MRKQICIFFILTLIILSTFTACGSSNTASVAETGATISEVQKYSIISETPPTEEALNTVHAQHQFAPETEQNGLRYILKDVRYELVGRQPEKEKKILEIKDLYDKNASPEQFPTFFNSTNHEVIGTLEEITYSDTVITNRQTQIEAQTLSGWVIAQPSAAGSKTVGYPDEQSGRTITATLPLRDYRVTTAYHWRDDVTVPMRVEVYDSSFYELNGRYVPYNDEQPALAGYERDLLAVLELPEQAYRITGFTWDGAVYTENGVQYRNAVASGKRYVAEYTAYYSDTVALPDAAGYTATVTYQIDSGRTEYLYRATAIYEQQGLTPAQIIMISVGVILLVALIIAILFILAKNKKSREKGV